MTDTSMTDVRSADEPDTATPTDTTTDSGAGRTPAHGTEAPTGGATAPGSGPDPDPAVPSAQTPAGSGHDEGVDELLPCGCPVGIVADEGHQEGCSEPASGRARVELTSGREWPLGPGGLAATDPDLAPVPHKPQYLGESPRVDDETHVCSWCGRDDHDDVREAHRPSTGGYYADEIAPFAAELPRFPDVEHLDPAALARVLATQLHGHFAVFAPGCPHFEARVTDDGDLEVDVTWYAPLDAGPGRCRGRFLLHVGPVEPDAPTAAELLADGDRAADERGPMEATC